MSKGKKLPISANKHSNRAPRSICLMLRGRWPVMAILKITCLTMHFLISWRWMNTDTSTGSIAKCTLAALTKPPKSPPRGNYERILAKTYAEAERSGSTVSDQRLKERRAGKKIAQLGEQANQSCPPLKVSKDIVANDPRMVAGYSNLGDYTPDDVHYEIMEVDEHKYHYGKPLVKDERSNNDDAKIT